MKNQGLGRAEIKKKVEAVGEMLQLTSYLTRLPKALSGGQRQRVAIGRAIVRGAKVFLFDEPLSNLDAALRVQMRMEIAKLKRDLPNTTMVYVTHDQVEAMTMADRIVVLQAGKVEQVGTPMELYERPGSVFVAGFIGSPKMNFITGAPATKLKAKTIGVRPEHFEFSDAKTDISGTLDYTEILGSDSFLYVTTPSGMLTVRQPGRTEFKTGQKLNLKPLAQHDIFGGGGKDDGCAQSTFGKDRRSAPHLERNEHEKPSTWAQLYPQGTHGALQRPLMAPGHLIRDCYPGPA